ncbi:DNA primase [Lactococcus ileimucosae]|uniref:DNA primase n=1 Tax=Lactococcus ileimucosae TaxID=2941329 RepID=UPI003514B287
MSFLTKEELTELKNQVNIADLISQYVSLVKSGKNYLGLCPFHGEKTPSFNVNAEKGFYHCFGCGKSGDAIDFIKDYKQVGFVDAVKDVADFAGITLNIENNGVEEKDNPNALLYDINNQAARLYHIVLTSTEIGEQARLYLEKRGITSEIIKQFNIGLAPDENDFIFENLAGKFDETVQANSGLFNFSSNKVFDAFQNRIMFPLKNEYGHVVGFSGRKWQEGDTSKAKYINTSATSIFDKSYELYNLDKAKPTISKTREVYLMEGFMDVIAAHKAGIFNVVATMGTALTDKHVKRLRKIAKNYVLIYDGDNAGQNAIYKAIDLIGESKTQIVRVPEGLDPDDYSKKYSLEALANLMENGRIQPTEFLIDYLKPENLSNLQNQLDFIEQMAPVIARVPSITAQDAFIRKLVEILPDFEYNQVEQSVNLKRENVLKSRAETGNFEESFGNFDEEQFSNYPDPGFISGEHEYYESFPLHQQEVIAPVRPQPNLSRSERAEEQLLNRMIYHQNVLQKFADDETFRFVHQRYQNLFEKIILEAMSFDEIDPSHFGTSLDAEEKNLFYQILSLDLPEETSSQELEDLVVVFAKEMEQIKFSELQKQLENAQKLGNKERELELTIQIINQKKKI